MVPWLQHEHDSFLASLKILKFTIEDIKDVAYEEDTSMIGKRFQRLEGLPVGYPHWTLVRKIDYGHPDQSIYPDVAEDGSILTDFSNC